MRGKAKMIKEAFAGLIKPVTIRYPVGKWPGRKYSHVPAGLRGRPKIDGDTCTGCGACVAQCSAGAITISDGDDKRTVSIFTGQCIFCGRCEDICPFEAVELGMEFELAYHPPQRRQEAYVRSEVELKKCRICGNPIAPVRQLGWIREQVLQEIDPSVRDVVRDDMQTYMDHCTECRKRFSFQWGTHTRKFY
ncbi:TPA: 4Fe-4S dicluster domain-containing protein [Candidatus Bathyarchaeota archaeon]|nr:4Fe-4S dicluster domain-containing protein [Candidatus Bathyarchaeota archaeon]